MYRVDLRLAGLEPATLWFEATYSIQLSYRRTDALDITEILGMKSVRHASIRLHAEHRPLISIL